MALPESGSPGAGFVLGEGREADEASASDGLDGTGLDTAGLGYEAAGYEAVGDEAVGDEGFRSSRSTQNMARSTLPCTASSARVKRSATSRRATGTLCSTSMPPGSSSALNCWTSPYCTPILRM